MKRAAIAAAVLSAALAGSAWGQQQTTLRDSSGRIIGTIATDNHGQQTFRDAAGRLTGTATQDNHGTTTIRDQAGRIVGTSSAGR